MFHEPQHLRDAQQATGQLRGTRVRLIVRGAADQVQFEPA
jgi:hypothetical protein